MNYSATLTNNKNTQKRGQYYFNLFDSQTKQPLNSDDTKRRTLGAAMPQKQNNPIFLRSVNLPSSQFEQYINKNYTVEDLLNATQQMYNQDHGLSALEESALKKLFLDETLNKEEGDALERLTEITLKQAVKMKDEGYTVTYVKVGAYILARLAVYVDIEHGRDDDKMEPLFRKIVLTQEHRNFYYDYMTSAVVRINKSATKEKPAEPQFERVNSQGEINARSGMYYWNAINNVFEVIYKNWKSINIDDCKTMQRFTIDKEAVKGILSKISSFIGPANGLIKGVNLDEHQKLKYIIEFGLDLLDEKELSVEDRKQLDKNALEEIRKFLPNALGSYKPQKRFTPVTSEDIVFNQLLDVLQQVELSGSNKEERDERQILASQLLKVMESVSTQNFDPEVHFRELLMGFTTPEKAKESAAKFVDECNFQSADESNYLRKILGGYDLDEHDLDFFKYDYERTIKMNGFVEQRDPKILNRWALSFPTIWSKMYYCLKLDVLPLFERFMAVNGKYMAPTAKYFLRKAAIAIASNRETLRINELSSSQIRDAFLNQAGKTAADLSKDELEAIDAILNTEAEDLDKLKNIKVSENLATIEPKFQSQSFERLYASIYLWARILEVRAINMGGRVNSLQYEKYRFYVKAHVEDLSIQRALLMLYCFGSAESLTVQGMLPVSSAPINVSAEGLKTALQFTVEMYLPEANTLPFQNGLQKLTTSEMLKNGKSGLTVNENEALKFAFSCLKNACDASVIDSDTHGILKANNFFVFHDLLVKNTIREDVKVSASSTVSPKEMVKSLEKVAVASKWKNIDELNSGLLKNETAHGMAESLLQFLKLAYEGEQRELIVRILTQRGDSLNPKELELLDGVYQKLKKDAQVPPTPEEDDAEYSEELTFYFARLLWGMHNMAKKEVLSLFEGYFKEANNKLNDTSRKILQDYAAPILSNRYLLGIGDMSDDVIIKAFEKLARLSFSDKGKKVVLSILTRHKLESDFNAMQDTWGHLKLTDEVESISQSEIVAAVFLWGKILEAFALRNKGEVNLEEYKKFSDYIEKHVQDVAVKTALRMQYGYSQVVESKLVNATKEEVDSGFIQLLATINYWVVLHQDELKNDVSLLEFDSALSKINSLQELESGVIEFTTIEKYALGLVVRYISILEAQKKLDQNFVEAINKNGFQKFLTLVVKATSNTK